MSPVDEDNIIKIGSATQRAWFYCGEPVYFPSGKSKGKVLSHYEVDWRNKVVVILDNVNDRTMKDLKPVMSHDNPTGTIDIHATMKVGGKFKTMLVKIHGSPAFINCSTVLKWDDELTTRHFFLTPRDDPIKYEAAAKLILERETTGKEPVGPRVEEVRRAIKYLIDQNIKVRMKAEVAEELKGRWALYRIRFKAHLKGAHFEAFRFRLIPRFLSHTAGLKLHRVESQKFLNSLNFLIATKYPK